ncbi:MAG: uroporphyrinogen-III C-methyltransferase, partial [Desulfovibrio sp.]|nr:uroporphyrinogen-III C-methyltransferase [Desulfovibrio sp.]
ARPKAERIYVGKIADQHALPQPEINALLVRKAREGGGRVVARLKGGDPYIFGRGGEEAEALVAAGVPFEEVPGVSSAIAAPAYAGIPLTHRDFASSVTIITGHESPDKPGSVHNWEALAKSASTLVFVMGMKNLPDIAANLIRAGMRADMPAALVYRGTTPRQRSLVAPLGELPAEAVARGFSNPSVIVVGEVARLHQSLDWFGKKPLLGRRVVVTRAREQASGLAGRLTELGCEVIQFPTIEIREPHSYAPLDAAIAELGGYDWLIFTSVNGVRHFWRRLEAAGKDSRALGGLRVAAIGPATAEALWRHGIRADFVPDKYQAEGVLEGLTALAGDRLAGLRFLLPRAAEASELLPQELRKAGAVVDVLTAYETVPAGARKDEVLRLLEAGELDCVSFGSSSTVENFLALVPAELLRQHPGTALAAIGPITAKTLERHGFTADIMPQDSTIPALADAIAAHFSR